MNSFGGVLILTGLIAVLVIGDRLGIIDRWLVGSWRRSEHRVIEDTHITAD